jgi:hypothetical protein
MPNWCDNSLTISGDTEAVLAAVEMLSERPEGKIPHLAFGTILPRPKGVDDPGTLIEWSIAEWGTKWDIAETDGAFEVFESPLPNVDLMATAAFQTAWSPPIPFYRKATVLCPEVRMETQWMEEGLNFRGKAVFQGGDNLEFIEEEGPWCDTCDQNEENAGSWCGACGNCNDHCAQYEDCPEHVNEEEE